MNSLTIASQNQTMSSREIADLVESRHDAVKKSIERLVDRDVIQCPPMANFKNINNVEGTEYLICKRDSYIIVAQLSPEFTAKLVDRWQELESQQIPKTLPEALRLAADLAERNAALENKIEADAPAVAFFGNYVEAKSSKCLSDVAKILRYKPQEFIAMMAYDGVIFKRSGAWVPYQNHIDSGRFTVKTGESNGYCFEQTRVEPSGIAWLATKYGKIETSVGGDRAS